MAEPEPGPAVGARLDLGDETLLVEDRRHLAHPLVARTPLDAREEPRAPRLGAGREEAVERVVLPVASRNVASSRSSSPWRCGKSRSPGPVRR